MHPKPNSLTSYYPNILAQQGLLFGLDARLALGIFAVMSVVAGYSMFGRINIAKDAALVSELTAMENALNHYQTDMGTFYLFTLNKTDGDDSSLEDVTALWNKNMVKPGFQKNWHGPYVGFESRKHRTYGNWSLFYAQPDRQNYCMTDTDCYIWLSLSNVPEPVWNKINAYFDEANGSAPESPENALKEGKVQADAATNPRTLIFRTTHRPATL